MRPKFPEEVAYLGGLIRSADLVEDGETYELHIRHEREFLEHLDGLFHNHFGERHRFEDGKVVLESHDALDILLEHFGSPDEDGRWEMTDDIRLTRPRHRKAFLRGLFDGMGNVDDNVVLDYRWNPDDLEEISEMLEELGIESETEDCKLVIEDLETFMAEIGTDRPSHENRLRSLIAG